MRSDSGAIEVEQDVVLDMLLTAFIDATCDLATYWSAALHLDSSGLFIPDDDQIMLHSLVSSGSSHRQPHDHVHSCLCHRFHLICTDRLHQHPRHYHVQSSS